MGIVTERREEVLEGERESRGMETGERCEGGCCASGVVGTTESVGIELYFLFARVEGASSE